MSDALAVKVAVPGEVMVPEAVEDRLTEGGVVSGAAFTVSVKLVVLESPPPVPESVIVKFPVGVEERVESVKVLVQVGLQLVGEKLAVVPLGSPEAEKETDCVAPERSVAVTVVDTDPP